MTKRSLQAFVRPHMRTLEPYVGVEPPEILAENAGVKPERILKLDANENPYGPSPKVMESLQDFSRFNIYPDPLQRGIRKALSAYAGVPETQVVAGSGADEIIELLVRLFIQPGDKVIHFPPTFGMYEVATRISKGEMVGIVRDQDLRIDVEETERRVDKRTKLLFLANPNNPTGTLTGEDSIRKLLDLDVIVAIDETYHEFCGTTAVNLLRDYDNLVVIRSFSKWAGLAGLRIGYGLMSAQLADFLLNIKSPYNVSVAAEAAMLASLSDTDLLLQRVRDLVEERERLAASLQKISGIYCFPSKGNFLLCRFPDRMAEKVYSSLAHRGIFVRKFSNNQIKNCLRISIGKDFQNDAVVDAITDIMVGKK